MLCAKEKQAVRSNIFLGTAAINATAFRAAFRKGGGQRGNKDNFISKGKRTPYT